MTPKTSHQRLESSVRAEPTRVAPAVRDLSSLARDAFPSSTLSPGDGAADFKIAGLASLPKECNATAIGWWKKAVPAAVLGDDELSQGELAAAALREWRRVLAADVEGAALFDALRSELAELERLEDAALQTMQVALRQRERQWNHLHDFFDAATEGCPDKHTSMPVTLINAPVAALLADPAKWNELVESFVPFDTLEQQNLTSLFVFAEPIEEPADLKRVGLLAERTRGLAIVPFKSCELDEALALFANAGEYADLKSNEPWAARVMLAGNEYTAREATARECDGGVTDPLWLSHATLLAGAIHRGDEADCPAIPQVGPSKSRLVRTRDGSKVRLRWNLSGKIEAQKLHRSVVPLMWRKHRLVSWGIESLASSKQVLAQYTCMRVKSHLEKVIAQMLDGYAFTPKDEDRLREELNRYLRGVTDARRSDMLLASGRAFVSSVPESQGKTLKIRLELGLKVATEEFVIETMLATLSATANAGAGNRPVLSLN